MKFKELVEKLTDSGMTSEDAVVFIAELGPFQKADELMLKQYNVPLSLEKVNELLEQYHDEI